MIELPEIQEISKRHSAQMRLQWEEVHGPMKDHGLLGLWSWWMACTGGKLLQGLQPNHLFFFLGGHGFQGVWKGERSTVPMEEKVVQFIRGEWPLQKMAAKVHTGLTMVDCGTAYSYERDPDYWLYQQEHFLVRKVGDGTRPVAEYAAMTTDQYEQAFRNGRDLLDRFYHRRVRLCGITHVDPLSEWMTMLVTAVLESRRPSELIWRQTPGEEAVRQLNRWAVSHPKSRDIHSVLTLYGGFELTTMIGFLIQAASRKVAVVLDGPVAMLAGKCAAMMDERSVGWMLPAGRAPFEAPDPRVSVLTGEPGGDFFMQLAGLNLARQFFP